MSDLKSSTDFAQSVGMGEQCSPDFGSVYDDFLKEPGANKSNSGAVCIGSAEAPGRPAEDPTDQRGDCTLPPAKPLRQHSPHTIPSGDASLVSVAISSLLDKGTSNSSSVGESCVLPNPHSNVGAEDKQFPLSNFLSGLMDRPRQLPHAIPLHREPVETPPGDKPTPNPTSRPFQFESDSTAPIQSETDRSRLPIRSRRLDHEKTVGSESVLPPLSILDDSTGSALTAAKLGKMMAKEIETRIAKPNSVETDSGSHRQAPNKPAKPRSFDWQTPTTPSSDAPSAFISSWSSTTVTTPLEFQPPPSYVSSAGGVTQNALQEVFRVSIH